MPIKIEFNEDGSIKLPDSVKNLKKKISKKEYGYREKYEFDWFTPAKEMVSSTIPVIEKDSNRKYFLCITRPQNCLKCIENKTWGAVIRDRKKIEKMSPGDLLVFYVTPKQVGVICKVTSKFFVDKEYIVDDKGYFLRIRIEPIFIPKEPKFLDQTMINKLDFLTIKDSKWSGVLQHAVKEISEEDFFKLFDFMKND
jgi:predicted RNA-binding protein